MGFRILEKMLRQKAVYWEPIWRDQFGDLLYDSPVEIKCRWEDELVNVVDAAGREQVFEALVYTDRDVKIEGLLFLGTEGDLEGAEPPQAAKRIRRFEKLPTLKADKFLRTAYL